MHILLTVLHTFHMELVGRIYLNINILGDHYLYSHHLNVWTSSGNVKRNFIFITVIAERVKVISSMQLHIHNSSLLFAFNNYVLSIFFTVDNLCVLTSFMCQQKYLYCVGSIWKCWPAHNNNTNKNSNNSKRITLQLIPCHSFHQSWMHFLYLCIKEKKY